MLKIVVALMAAILTLNGYGQSAANGSYIDVSQRDTDKIGQRETVIWSETFDEGIPFNWVNLGSPALAVWEYRGPSTNPDNTIGTRGSCIPEGQLGGAPIDSETAEDGFIIFDSNFWDDAIGPCGNFGSGTAPGPHTTSIATPGINLSGYSYVGLRFHQYAKNYNAVHKIQISLNGQAFFDVYSQDLGFNGETLRDDIINVNITNYAANQPNVRVRFLFEGNYYFWMIDDVQLIELDSYDLEIASPTYADFDFDNPDHPTGFEYMEYSMYPQTMSPELKFSAQITNLGGEVMEEVVLNVEVNRTSSPQQQIHTASSESIVLQPGGDEVLRAGNFGLPLINGTYDVVFETEALQEDLWPDNNSATRNFEITNGIYARDRRALEGIYVPAPDEQNIPFEIGNIFLVTSANQSLYSIECGLSLGTLTGSEVYAAIYEFDLNVDVTADLIAQTPLYIVQPEDLNDAGEQKMKLLNFESPVALEQGRAYAVMVGAETGSPNVLMGISGAVPSLTSWIHFPDADSWFFLSYAPMVRMNFLDPDGVSEIKKKNATLNLWPNPAEDQLFVETNDLIELSILSITGDLIRTFSLPISDGVMELNLHELAPAQYIMKGVKKDGSMVISKVILN
jgi:hypothetical protein